MTAGEDTTPRGTREFVAADAGRVGRAALIALGVVGLVGMLVVIATLVLLASGSISPGLLGGICGPIGAASVLSIVAGVAQRRDPDRAVVCDDALLIESASSRRVIPWSTIARVEVVKDEQLLANAWVGRTKYAPPEPRALIARDAAGKRLCRLRSARFDAFDDLVEQVQRRSGLARGEPTRDENREHDTALRKARAMGVLAIVAGGLLAFGCVWIIRAELQAREIDRALADTGVEIGAELTDHRMHNGIAPRIEYRFTDPAGETREADVMLTRDAWRALDGADTVRVLYLPADTTHHRPLDGYKPPSRMNGPMLWLLAAAGVLVPGFLVGAGILQLFGIDGVSLDKRGLRFKRVGAPEPA